ncbi:hypothetical protein IL306_012620 [Fusarium sp. DS 682]|nr:hypothetical protein IL306_012620 [Fusarium sp. DS 682]
MPWYPRKRPTIPPTDRDARLIDKINDTFTASAAYKDTSRIFPREIELSRAGDKMAWVEGQMLGEADEETKAPISVSQEFIFPGDHTDSRSSTSRGHQIPHLRPPRVGAGWGWYDEFRQWQAHGRSINKDWVKEGDSQKTKTSPLAFTDDNGVTEVVCYSNDKVAKILSRTDKVESLHMKLESRDIGKTHQTVRKQGARRGHGSVRGGRGGRGGRGTTSFW